MAVKIELGRRVGYARLAAAWLFVVSGILTSGCETASHSTPAALGVDDNVIVPGQRLGLVTLGMTPDALLQALGPPDSSRGPSANRIQHRYNGRGLFVYVNVKSNRVDGVGTSDGRYRTARSVRVGASELELVSAQGAPKWRWHNAHGGDDGYVVYCYRDGTDFSLGGPSAKDAGRIRTVTLGGCQP
jgi:hypothetical protein